MMLDAYSVPHLGPVASCTWCMLDQGPHWVLTGSFTRRSQRLGFAAERTAARIANKAASKRQRLALEQEALQQQEAQQQPSRAASVSTPAEASRA